MTPRVRVLRIRPPYSVDCPHCLELLRAEADAPHWLDWFRTAKSTTPVARQPN
ncbi:hypothetical protein SEA_BLINO_38 [Gordonia phage Blino]|uniref:Uncharacterized protein n=1 Tax=Gordonia phage Blino TaxID=2793696 RepID=A0A7T0M0U8_9CAUD|nr:hypothetical protein KNV70_gp38 [Gordonia phage Blino]QPL13986.1 hypothetical protein SEA_BLINO_38 [Gordonia phage Blino]